MKLRVKIFEVNNEIESEIQSIDKKLIPLKKDGWNFNWRELSKVEGSQLFGLSCISTPNSIEGIVMLTLFNDEMLFMNNIEVAPHNIGIAKKYENVAGCLIAYACRNSFELGVGDYNGYLSFNSKTKLVELYKNKYGATLAMGNKMFFTPEAGKKLMKKYLQIKK